MSSYFECKNTYHKILKNSFNVREHFIGRWYVIDAVIKQLNTIVVPTSLLNQKYFL